MNEKLPYAFWTGLAITSVLSLVVWPVLSRTNKRYHIEVTDTNPASFPHAAWVTNASHKQAVLAGPDHPVFTNGTTDPFYGIDPTNAEGTAQALLSMIKTSRVTSYNGKALTYEQLAEMRRQTNDPLAAVKKKHPELFTPEPLTNDYVGPYTNIVIVMDGPHTNNNDYGGPYTHISSSPYLIPRSDPRPVWLPFPKFSVKETPGALYNTFEYAFESEIEPTVTRITNVYGDLRWEVRIK